MKRFSILLTMLLLSGLLFSASPVLAGEGDGCEGDCGEDVGRPDGGCDMEVNIGVSGNSEVTIATGDNSKVEVLPGPCNDIFINGQNINEPTVIHTQTSNYNASYSRRLSILEYWRKEANGTVQLVADGLSQLIMEYESGEIDSAEMERHITELETIVASLNRDIALLDGFTNDSLSSQRIEYLAMIDSLKIEVYNLKWAVEKQRTDTIWWIIGLLAGISILGGVLYQRTRKYS